MEEAEDRGTCGPSSQYTTRDPISVNRHDGGNSWLKLLRAMQWSALVGSALYNDESDVRWKHGGDVTQRFYDTFYLHIM